MEKRHIAFIVAALLLGLALGQRLPTTFLHHPIATMALMKSVPLGSRAVPQETISELNRLDGLDRHGYWIVVGYEAVTGLEGQTLLLCQVRTEDGTGPLLAINPHWILR